MKVLFFTALLIIASSLESIAQKHSFPYLDQEGVECVLTWNAKTGNSILYYYKSSEKRFAEAVYQLPSDPTEDGGPYALYPYLDPEGVECILAWNTKTGNSILYYYKSSERRFAQAVYQLPSDPTGDGRQGSYEFRPYLDQEGVECVLVSNTLTGNSTLYYYKSSERRFAEAFYQLPTID